MAHGCGSAGGRGRTTGLIASHAPAVGTSPASGGLTRLTGPTCPAPAPRTQPRRCGSHVVPRTRRLINLMVRSQSACSFQGPWNSRFPLRADALAAFSWLFHDREGFCTDKTLRDHEVPAQEPCPEVTSTSAGPFSPHSGRLHS